MKAKRNCQNCGKNDHMMRVVDAQYGVYDVRHRICYRCHPELDSGSHLNGPDGGLKLMKNEHRDASWDYCEPMPKLYERHEDDEDKYADDDTIVETDEMLREA